MSSLPNEFHKEAQFFEEEDDFDFEEDPYDFVISFSEEPSKSEMDSEELILNSPIVEEVEVDEDELMDGGDSQAMPFKLPSVSGLPGATDYVDDFEEEEPEEEEQTNWEEDRDPKHFMAYIFKQYPDNIPKHDGKSTLGCEKAIQFLTKLNKEISEALRADEDGTYLDVATLEQLRVEMINGIQALKEQVKKINKHLKKKKADEEVSFEKISEITKEATTAKIQLVMTPFERAITGIILNSVISAGKPIEDVYEFLKKKYKLTDREELSVLQLLMDMGYPIFKDRGIIGETDHDEEGDGIEFMKNYFA